MEKCEENSKFLINLFEIDKNMRPDNIKKEN